MTSAETAALRALADGAARGRRPAVNYNIRFYPLCHEIRDRVARGDSAGSSASPARTRRTGSPIRRLQLAGRARRRHEPAGGRRHRHALDGPGPVRHRPADPLRPGRPGDVPPGAAPAGRPVRDLHRARGRRRPGRPDHDRGLRRILLRFAAGPAGVFHVSQVTAGARTASSLEVAGTEGSLAGTASRPNRLWSAAATRRTQLLERDPALLSPRGPRRQPLPRRPRRGLPRYVQAAIRAVYGWIAAGGGRAAYPTFADGHREVRLCEAIAKEQEQGHGWTLRHETRIRLGDPAGYSARRGARLRRRGRASRASS